MIGLSNLEQNQSQKGLVHLYVGDGKGKTTAAAGIAVRFLGTGGAVLFCQFLKGRPTGELALLERMGARLLRAKTGEKFVFQMNGDERAELRNTHRECLAEAARIAAEGSVGLLVLDEVVDAVNCGAVELSQLLDLLKNRHPSVEVVMTGRNPDPAIAAAADYHTDFVCVAHPYKQGVAARRGVEY